MKRIFVSMMMVAVAFVLGGCATADLYGLDKGSAFAIMRYAAQREGISHAVTDDDFELVYSALAADEAIATRADEIAQDAIVKEKIEAAMSKYFPGGGEFRDPHEVADAGPHIVTKIDTWYGGEDLSGAVLDPDFQLTVSGDGRIWSAAPGDWPVQQDDDPMNVLCCAAYETDTGWVGGKFEWNRPNPSPRSFGHLSTYDNWVEPPDGATLVLWCASIDKKRVSTEATVTYNRD